MYCDKNERDYSLWPYTTGQHGYTDEIYIMSSFNKHDGRH